MKTEKEVYRILDKRDNESQGVYSRAYHYEYDFNSVSEARNSNCHGVYKDKGKYKIAKYKVTYELIEDDCDEAGQECYEEPEKHLELDEILGSENASKLIAELKKQFEQVDKNRKELIDKRINVLKDLNNQ